MIKPEVGTVQKVIKLTPHEWAQIEAQTGGNWSGYIRRLITEEMARTGSTFTQNILGAGRRKQGEQS